MSAPQTTPKIDFSEASKAPFDFIFMYNKTGPKAHISMRNLEVKVPRDKRVLIDNANDDEQGKERLDIEISSGEKVGFTGPNGSGKSSLFRVFGGLDSNGKGTVEITCPEDKTVFVASQEIRKVPKMLPGLLSYPNDEQDYSREEYEQALKDADLENALVHLPWNASKPEILSELLGNVLQQELNKQTGTLNPKTAQSFLKGFTKTMQREFDMPTLLQGYAEDDAADIVAETLNAKAGELLTHDPDKEEVKIMFPERAGKKAARSFIHKADTFVDGWILQGHRMRLSGGEQNKMNFARAFLQASEISVMLLDEPTAALKGKTAHDMVSRLFEKIPDATVIAIIHDETLRKHFDRHMKLGEDKSLTIKDIDHSEYEQADLSPAP